MRAPAIPNKRATVACSCASTKRPVNFSGNSSSPNSAPVRSATGNTSASAPRQPSKVTAATSSPIAAKSSASTSRVSPTAIKVRSWTKENSPCTMASPPKSDPKAPTSSGSAIFAPSSAFSRTIFPAAHRSSSATSFTSRPPTASTGRTSTSLLPSPRRSPSSTKTPAKSSARKPQAFPNASFIAAGVPPPSPRSTAKASSCGVAAMVGATSTIPFRSMTRMAPRS